MLVVYGLRIAYKNRIVEWICQDCAQRVEYTSMTVTVFTPDEQLLAQGELGEQVLQVEGNYYFDKSCVRFEHLKMTGEGQNYTCPMKRGTCDYYDLVNENGEVVIPEVGWIYEVVGNGLFEPIAGRMAFYGGKVEVISRD
jgi:uncharacterized protein (DUF427 family)